LAAARELARKVAGSVGAAIQGKLTIAPNFVNLSSLSSFEFQKACDAFHDEIEQRTQAFRAANSQTTEPASVSITLAEDLHGFLWIAQVVQGQSQRTFFVSVAHDTVVEPSQPGPSLTLQKEFLLSQPEPILDVDTLPASTGLPARLLVLQAERVALFAKVNGAWQIQAEAPIQHDHTWPRDVRGLLQQRETEEAILPGTVCAITTTTTFEVSCRPGDEIWEPAGSSLFFTLEPRLSPTTGLFTFPPGTQGEKFESIAAFERNGWIGTLPDGRALLFEGSSTPVASFPGWGDDIAALYSTTRTSWPLLVTRAGDWTTPDSVQAFDIVNRQAVGISGEIDFDGPITALWSEDENTVLAVSRNLKTGMYEAYFIHAVYNQ